jgi:hypothetical protein
MQTLLKYRITTLVLGALVMFASACDLTELNDDPNNPTAVPENLQLPALLANFSYEVIGNTAVRLPAVWTQQLTWNGVQPSAATYDVDEADVNNLWEFWGYTDAMKNARRLAAQAETNGNPAYAGIAKVIEAWTLSILTDLWGDLPYSEAFDLNNAQPAYDEQEEVYDAIFALLDEAIADLQATENLMVPSSGEDFIYGGDLARWERLAYGLKARFKMRLSEAPGYSEVQQAQDALAALENAFQSNADVAQFSYLAAPGGENPWYQYAIDGKWDTRDQLSSYYVDLLKSLRDPRLPIHARPVGAVGNNGLVPGFVAPAFTEEDYSLTDSTYFGHDSGAAGIGAENVSSIGAFFSSAGAPLVWMSYASSKFVQAEAVLITSGPGAAQPIFEEAIRADMQFLGVPGAEIDAYLANLPALTDAGVDAREAILTQKYIANFLQTEPYNDYRRVGYPALQPVDVPEARVDLIPLRFPYPSSELSRNAANVPAYVPLGFDALRVPVWWDTTVPAGALPNPTQ